LTSIAPDTELLQELDAETRQAWIAYSDRLRELSGDEYERVETESRQISNDAAARPLSRSREESAVTNANQDDRHRRGLCPRRYRVRHGRW
jgi:hypothetical protein